MKLILNYNDLNTILTNHVKLKGFEADGEDIVYTKDGVEIKVSDETKPYERIDFPMCPNVRDGMYPRCLNLEYYKYCNRIGGVCK